MFAVIDCGTTNTRIYIVSETGEILASGEERVGTRDTAVSGSKQILKEGIDRIYDNLLKKNGIAREQISFAVAAGMITSDIGLIEIPHISAPAGLSELAQGVVKCEDGEVLAFGCPVYFIRGIKNQYQTEETGRMSGQLDKIPSMDFMRGEEVQCMGLLQQNDVKVPCNMVVLSSHTKNIYIDGKQRIGASCTTISGQLYAALLEASLLKSSIIPITGETKRYSAADLISMAEMCVEHAGLGRTLLMTRFMQVLMQSHFEERSLFLNAAIAVDDMKSFDDMKQRGFDSGNYYLIGKTNRCDLYEELLRKRYGENLKICKITDKKQIRELTVTGNSAIISIVLQNERGDT